MKVTFNSAGGMVLHFSPFETSEILAGMGQPTMEFHAETAQISTNTPHADPYYNLSANTRKFLDELRSTYQNGEFDFNSDMVTAIRLKHAVFQVGKVFDRLVEKKLAKCTYGKESSNGRRGHIKTAVLLW